MVGRISKSVIAYLMTASSKQVDLAAVEILKANHISPGFIHVGWNRPPFRSSENSISVEDGGQGHRAHFRYCFGQVWQALVVLWATCKTRWKLGKANSKPPNPKLCEGRSLETLSLKPLHRRPHTPTELPAVSGGSFPK